MVRNRYFNHQSRTLGAVASMLMRARVPYKSYGETLAQGSSPTQIHGMWTHSPLPAGFLLWNGQAMKRIA